MLMPNKDRLAIYEFLFKEGVLVAEKDFHPKKTMNLNLNLHPTEFESLLKVPNLHVIKAMQSLRSRGYVKEQFAWRHYYWYLTNEGVQYLRDFLHLPADIVPATLKRATKPDAPRKYDDGASRLPRDGYRREEGARQGYGRGSVKPPATQ